MRVALQQPFPDQHPRVVRATLTITATADGTVVLAHQVDDLEHNDLLALGVDHPRTWKELPGPAQELLRALRDAVGTLLDLPPFP